MPLYKPTHELLAELGLSDLDEKRKTQMSSASSKGPGVVDLLSAVTSNSGNVFYRVESKKTKVSMPAIIVSNHWRKYFPVSDDELAMNDALMRLGFPVYVWRGKNKLEEMVAVKDAADLTEQLKGSVDDDEKVIRDVLAHYPNRDFSHCVVIDPKKYGVVPTPELINKFLTREEQAALLPHRLSFFDDTHYKELDLKNDPDVTTLELVDISG